MWCIWILTTQHTLHLNTTIKLQSGIDYAQINIITSALVVPWYPGPWFNIKMPSYQYRKSHCGDKTVVRSSYLHNEISYTGEMASLYWSSPQHIYWRGVLEYECKTIVIETDLVKTLISTVGYYMLFEMVNLESISGLISPKILAMRCHWWVYLFHTQPTVC